MKRLDYSEMVLDAAMKRTVPKYGPYRVEIKIARMNREDLLAKVLKGDEVNVSVVATQPSWEIQLLPIYVPPDMGLSNYRIALTTTEGQKRIDAVRNLDQFRDLKVGVGAAWSSRRVMEIAGFEVVRADNFDALLELLLNGKVDYFPRGLNEVFVEFDDRQATSPGLQVEKNMVLNFPLPGYVFVSPAHPRLHKRLSEGLESMVRDGTLLKMFLQYHAEMLKRADLCSRRVFRIDNPNLHNPKPLQRRALWFDPFSPGNGLCQKPIKAN